MPILATLQEVDLVNRLISVFPAPWVSDAALMPGGNLYSLLIAAFADPDLFIYQSLQYAAAATRIATATDTELDVASQDYFGNGLPRLPGESDTSFRARIKAQLLVPRVTRPAITSAVDNLTGEIARIIEPWATADVLCWDENSYWDIDTPSNPDRWGDDGLPYQGFIELSAPVFSFTAGQPVYGWDIGDAWDQGTFAWNDLQVQLSPQFQSQLYALLAAFKAFGTTIWVKFLKAVSNPAPIDLSGIVGFAQYSVVSTQVNDNIASLLQAIGDTFILNLETPGWNTNLAVYSPGAVNFEVESTVPSPDNESLGWFATNPSYLNPNGVYYSIRVPVNAGQTSITITPPADWNTSSIVTATPSWNTNIWLSARNSTTFTLSFSSPGPGSIDVIVWRSTGSSHQSPGIATVSTGGLSVSISVPAGFTLPYAGFTLPSWNTQVWLTNKTDSTVTANFNTPAPAGQSLMYVLMEGI